MSKAERTRQFIIEKTAPVFNAKGFAGTSLNDIVEATGLTKGSVYGNFGNKDEVALAVFDYNFGRISAYIRERVHARDTAIGKLLVYPEVYRDFLKIGFLKAGCPVLNTATEADDTHPALREKAVNALKTWRYYLEKIVARGIADKELKASAKPAEVASLVMTLIEGAVMIAKVTGKTAELHVAMDHLEKIIRDLER